MTFAKMVREQNKQKIRKDGRYLVLEDAEPAAHALQMSAGSSLSSSLRCSGGTPSLDVDVKMALISFSPEVTTMGIKASRNTPCIRE